MDRFNLPAALLNDRLFCRETSGRIRKFEPYRRGREDFKSFRCARLQNFCRSEPIDKGVDAAILRFLQAVKNLQSRNRITVWIVRVNAESLVGIREIVRIR